jgi:hypothetical protein
MKVKVQTEKVLPVFMRDNKPRIHAIPIIHYRPDGLPDGVHCGAWLDVDTRKVWKLLYGRPYVNADVIVRTHEDEFLSEFADQPYFPKNWEVIQSNNLWWLVRDEAESIAENEYKDIDNESILEIEQAILKVNRAGWAIDDYITLLIDKKDYHLFIADLSTACKDPQADDGWRIEQFLKLCKRDHILKLRNNARTVLHNLHYSHENIADYEKNKTYKHVYASFNRPINGLWASLGDAIYKHEDQPNRESMTPWSWVITKEPLINTQVKSYELTWGWSSRI